MPAQLHFISGLPRAGSTLLSALLRQNPDVHAGMTSPAQYLFASVMRGMSQEHATSVFIDEPARERVLRGVVESYHADRLGRQTVFDTNRAWCARLPAVARLWPEAVMVAMVRSPAWILDSMERLIRRNALEPSGIFAWAADKTVYDRASALMAGDGMIGFATNALREAVFDPGRERLLLVRYESLCADPAGVLAAIYRRIGVPAFAHDFANVEPDYEAMMFDMRMGTPGLHAVGARVQATARETVLPPDLFERYAGAAFWDTPGGLPANVEIV